MKVIKVYGREFLLDELRAQHATLGNCPHYCGNSYRVALICSDLHPG